MAKGSPMQEGVLCTVKPHTAPRTTKVKIILECTRGLPGRHLHIFCILISGRRGRGDVAACAVQDTGNDRVLSSILQTKFAIKSGFDF